MELTISKRRDDIEGLRALAVSGVIANHVSASFCPGGFAGVDVFFVISGFLIGSHLIRDIQQGVFSVTRFYAKRARRILPALTVMLVVVWLLGWRILTGPELQDLGKHMGVSALFGNNILLWFQNNYFDAPAATKPLLHLWSLGVEEQFYIIVPILLSLASRPRLASIRWVLLCAGISLLLTVVYPVPSFYLLDTRFWELGSGVVLASLKLATVGSMDSRELRISQLVYPFLLILSCCIAYFAVDDPWSGLNCTRTLALALLIVSACCSFSRRVRSSIADLAARDTPALGRQHWLGGVGIGLILFSYLAITSANWPGPPVVFAVLGTLLVIVAGPFSYVNRFLSLRPLVFLGSISYPLYLWHWPLLVFWKIYEFDTATTSVWIPIGLALLLAWVSKAMVEDPVRFGRIGGLAVPVPRLAMVVCVFIVIGLVGASSVATAGYPARFSPDLRALAEWPKASAVRVEWREGSCFLGPTDPGSFGAACTPIARSGVKRLLLWGDSHAAHLYPGLRAEQSSYEFDLLQWTSAGCPPLVGSLAGEESNCSRLRSLAWQQLRESAPDSVLLSAAWDRYLSRGSTEGQIAAEVAKTVAALHDLGVGSVIVLGPSPNWTVSEPAEVFEYMLRGQSTKVPIRLSAVASPVKHLDNAIAKSVGNGGRYVSVVNQLCNEQGCLVSGKAGQSPPDLLFQDQDHLTGSGARFLIDKVRKEIFE